MKRQENVSVSSEGYFVLFLVYSMMLYKLQRIFNVEWDKRIVMYQCTMEWIEQERKQSVLNSRY